MYEKLEDIRVYVQASEIADAIWNQVTGWNAFAQNTVGRQLVRAADSISANIAESYGRHHTGDVTVFLYYSRGSLYETRDWLGKAVRRNIGKKECLLEIMEQLKVLAPQLNAYISAKKKTLRVRQSA